VPPSELMTAQKPGATETCPNAAPAEDLSSTDDLLPAQGDL
jgi:hypothetical protein